METRWSLKLEDKAAKVAKRIKREVDGLKAAMRELATAADVADRALGGFGGGAVARNLRTQIGLTKELGREMRRNTTESRRAPGSGGSAVNRGRTRLDVGGDAGGRGGRTRQEGFTLQQQERLRRMRQQGVDREARDRGRAQQREERESGAHYGRIYRSNQSAQAWGQRKIDRARRDNQRATEQHRRDQADPIGAATRRFRSSNPRLAGAMQIGGLALGAAGAVAGIIRSIIETTLAAVAAVAGLAAGFLALSFSIGHSILEMISFRESTLMTLSTLMRVDGEASMSPAQRQAARGRAAQGEFQWAQQFGRETPLSTQQVVELRTQASTAGYQGRDAREITAAAADAGALHPGDASTASRFMLQMGQLRNSSVARSADYRPAAQAAGVNETAAMRRAAIAAGVVQRNGENESAYQRRIRTAQGNGSITGRQMHDAILAEQNSMLGNRNHGDFARSQSGSIAAVLSNLGEGAEAFVTSIHDIENLPGIRALKAMLTQIADTLAGTTRNGKRLQAFFATFVNEAAGMVGGIFGEGGFDGALSEALDVAKELYPIVRGVLNAFRTGFTEGFAPFLTELREGSSEFMAGGGRDLIQWAREFGRGLAVLSVFMLRVTGAVMMLGAQAVAGAGPLYDLLTTLQEIAGTLRSMQRRAADPMGALREQARDAILPPGSGRRDATDWLGITRETPDEFHGIGADMGDGVSRGFRSRQSAMQAEVAAVMNSLPTQARTTMQIKSPSRVMAEIGEYMAMGVGVGLDSGAAGVQSSMANVVAPPGLPGFGGLGGMGSGFSVGGITVIVEGGATNEETGNALATKIEEVFVGLFQRAQLAGGA